MKYRVLLVVLSLWIQAVAAQTSVKINFRNVVDGRKLVLNDSTYTNPTGEVYTLTMCKYYISNIAFIRPDGTVVNIEDTYHLVNEAKPSSLTYKINAVPPGSYSAIKFMIGVDSLQNVSGAQGGELDPINAMFWDWNTGYIMAKIEGRSAAAPDGEITYHIGGFAGNTSSLRRATINLPHPLEVAANTQPTINIDANIGEWFKTPNTILFSKLPIVTTEGKEAAMIADNYADMFTLKNIEE